MRGISRSVRRSAGEHVRGREDARHRQRLRRRRRPRARRRRTSSGEPAISASEPGDEEALDLAAAHTIPPRRPRWKRTCEARAAGLVPLADLPGDFGAGAEQPRLHGAVRKVEGLADLLVGQAVEVPENEDLGEVLGDLGERREEELRALLLQGHARRVVLGFQERRHGFVGDETEGLLALAAPVSVDAEVARDREDPGHQGEAAVVAVEVLEDLQEDLLGQLLGVLALHREVVRDGVHPRSEPVHQLPPGFVVALPAAGDQIFVFGGAHACLNRTRRRFIKNVREKLRVESRASSA